jgi:hypothetical protein
LPGNNHALQGDQRTVRADHQRLRVFIELRTFALGSVDNNGNAQINAPATAGFQSQRCFGQFLVGHTISIRRDLPSADKCPTPVSNQAQPVRMFRYKRAPPLPTSPRPRSAANSPPPSPASSPTAAPRVFPTIADSSLNQGALRLVLFASKANRCS